MANPCIKALAAALAFAALAGCQLQSSNPTDSFKVRGNYKAVADCFYLKISGEGFWKIEDLSSMKTSRVIMGDAQFQAGRVEFVEFSPSETQVTMIIPHPTKFAPIIRGCAG